MRARHATAPLVAAFAKYSQRTELGLGGVTAPDRWWLQRVAIPEAAAAARVSTGSEHSEASWSNRRAAAHRRTRRPAQIRHATGQMERPSRFVEPCEPWMAQEAQKPCSPSYPRPERLAGLVRSSRRSEPMA
jgi:hypothetical protein